ncbi:MAG: drug/metabolite exporter YedA [Nitrospirae bacterium]|nr:MAG: drug/metabolite exporter YedA [Nitrospirota bacterium]
MGIKAIKDNGKAVIIVALLAVYISWGSTYLAIRIALEDLPPFLMMGIRFLIVGIGLYLYLRIRGASAPDRSQWINATLIGGLLLLGGSGGVAFAEQWVSSGIAALMIATTPLWTVLFAGIWKRWPAKLEWAGLLLGLAGVIILNFEGDLKASPAGAAALIIAAISWAFGSAWSLRLSLPPGLMAGAIEMITGGILVLMAGLLTGEKIVAMPSLRSIAAVLYLAVFGSLVGFTAYMYLLNRVRPALATSYAYVNPVIAVILGVWLVGEKITATGITAMVVIIIGVLLVMFGQRRS